MNIKVIITMFNSFTLISTNAYIAYFGVLNDKIVEMNTLEKPSISIATGKCHPEDYVSKATRFYFGIRVTKLIEIALSDLKYKLSFTQPRKVLLCKLD